MAGSPWANMKGLDPEETAEVAETGEVSTPEEKNFLEQTYDTLSESIPRLAKEAGAGIVSNAITVNDALEDFFYEAKQIPTLSGDLSKPGAVPTMQESLQRAGAAEAARRPGWETALIKGAREVGNIVEGAQDLMDAPAGINKYGGGAERIAERERIRGNVDPIMEGVGAARPVSSAVGATVPYFTPGLNMPLKALEAPLRAAAPVLNKGARTLYGVGSKLPEGKLSRGFKGAGIDLRMIPKRVPQSMGLNTIAQGAIVGGLHPNMETGEGAFYAAGGYGLGKLAAGKFMKPKNYNTKEKNEVIKWGKDIGYDIDPGVQTGDIRMQQIDQGFSRNADTAGPYQLAKIKNRDLNNRIVTKLVGQETDNVSAEWFENTGKQLRQATDEIYDKLTPSHNKSLHSRTNAVLTRFENTFGHQNLPGQYNSNWDPTIHLYTNKLWDMFKRPTNDVPIELWKGVRGQLDEVIDTFAKRPDKAHLMPYLNDLSDIADDMLKGSKNKEFLARLERTKLKKAVRWHAMSTQTVPGEVNMDNLSNAISKKYGAHMKGTSKTENKNLDNFYNSMKLHKAMQDTHGASLSVSDRISKLFSNPIGKNTGKLGYLFSKNAHEVGRINSSIINMYRRSPGLGLPNKAYDVSLDELAGAITGRYAFSEQ